MTSSHEFISNSKCLTTAQKSLLRQCKIREFQELILTPPSELSRRLKRPLTDVESIIECVCKEHGLASFRRLNSLVDDKFTTGDEHLDTAIGGGIRTGMIWELTGESASGKTQLALQMSLLVQLRPLLGGLSGSTCYITTHSKLPTKRLNQLIEEHPLLSPSICSLSDVHTLSAPNVELLTRSLTAALRSLQQSLLLNDARKPVRLIIIDSFSSLFQSTEKTSTSGLVQRSKALSELSHIMHDIAARDNVAFVIVNDVVDVFMEAYTVPTEVEGDILYRNQARWFNSAHSLPGESSKEAALGLVWANQVNVRIMLSRTNRRKYLEEAEQDVPAKRRRLDDGHTDYMDSSDRGFEPNQPTLIRRLSVIFSTISTSNSVDFVITRAGISVLAQDGVGAPIPLEPPGRAETSGRSVEGLHTPPKTLDTILLADALEDKLPSQTTARFTSALTVDLSPDTPDISSDPQLEVIPSTFPEEVDALDTEEPYWEEFDDMADPGLDELDNVMDYKGSEQQDTAECLPNDP